MALVEPLEREISSVSDLEVEALHGEFENLIPDILRFVGRSFSLVLIDPTGWTGFGLQRITPILQHRPGEVLINFMFDYVNRFLDDARPDEAMSRLRLLLRTKRRVKYVDVLGVLLEMPLVWESDVHQIVKDMRKAREIDVEGIGPRERTVKREHVLVSRALRAR
jgi:three-Cys-motif partner protein